MSKSACRYRQLEKLKSKFTPVLPSLKTIMGIEVKHIIKFEKHFL
jgi:hypothetical protein